MPPTLESLLSAKRVAGSGEHTALKNPTTEEVLAETSTAGLDFRGGLDFARKRGGPALRELSFAQRGELLLAMSSALHARRDEPELAAQATEKARALRDARASEG